MAERKENTEYMTNFGKKGSLVGIYNGKKYILYKGSLRSILKYSTFMYKRSGGGTFRINSMFDFKKKLKENIDKREVSSVIDAMDIYMGMDVNGNNIRELFFCNDRAVLYVTSKDIYNVFTKNIMIKGEEEYDNPPEEKMNFIEKVLLLYDENYKEHMNKSGTPLDAIKYDVSYEIRMKNYRNHNFRLNTLCSDAAFDTIITSICKDVSKKALLLQYMRDILGIRVPISDDELDNRTSNLKRKLEDAGEGRSAIEQSISSVINKKILKKKTVLETKDNDDFNNKEIKLNDNDDSDSKETTGSTRGIYSHDDDPEVDAYYDYDDELLRNIIKELKETIDPKQHELLLRRYNERSYELYLRQNNFNIRNDNKANNGGDILFEQEYDMDEDQMGSK